jgi:hypothetical protein
LEEQPRSTWAGSGEVVAKRLEPAVATPRAWWDAGYPRWIWTPPLLAVSLSDGQCVWHVYEDLGQPSLEHQADAEALESLRGADAALTEEQAALRDCLLADVATR